MENLNYEKDISIDENALDLEWLDQPALVIKYSRLVADLRMQLDNAKESVDVVKAQLDSEIRKNPELFEIEGKITEAVITNTIIQQEAFQEANNEYFEGRYEFDMAVAATKALEHKKSALENLVKLHGQQYFAGPNIPRDIKQEREKRNKKTESGIANKMKRKN